MGLPCERLHGPRTRADGTGRAIGADRIELYTEAYAVAHARGNFESTLAAFIDTAVAANEEVWA